MTRQAQWFDRDVERAGSDVSLAAPEPDHWFSEGDEDEEDLSGPVGRNLHWLVDPDAQRVRRKVQFSPGVVDAALRTTDSPKAAFRFLLADDINLSDEDLDKLLRSRSLEHKKTVGAPPPLSPAKAPPADTPSTADEAQTARAWLEAFGQGIILNVFYGVNLTADSERDPDKYTDWQAWMRHPERVTEAYKAVVSTAAALKRANDAAHKQGGDPKLSVASYMPGGIPEFLLFRQVMGPIRMNLSNSQRDYSAEVSPDLQQREGMLIEFYRLTLNGSEQTEFIPSQYNVVHELGHVIDACTKSKGRERISLESAQTHPDDYLEQSGVAKNAGLRRQNESTAPLEEWADRFLFWVYHAMEDPVKRTPLGLKSDAKYQMDQWMADMMGIAFGRGLRTEGLISGSQGVLERYKIKPMPAKHNPDVPEEFGLRERQIEGPPHSPFWSGTAGRQGRYPAHLGEE